MKINKIILVSIFILLVTLFRTEGKDLAFNDKNIKLNNNSLIELLNPNGGEIYFSGSDTLISWNSQLSNKKYSLELSTDKGKSWEVITNNLTGNSYKWKIPILNSNNCLVRIANQNDNTSALDSFAILGYGKLTGITFSPDDKYAVSRSENGFIIVWDVSKGEIIKKIYNELSSISLISLGSKNIVAYPSKNNQVKLLNIETDNVDSIEVNLPGVLTVLEWNPNGEDLLIGDNRGHIRIINTVDKSLKYQIYKNSSSVQSVSWNKQGNNFVAGYGDGAIRIWYLNNGVASDKLITYHSGLASCVSWSPSGKLIASGGVDHRIMIHDTIGNTIKSLAAHTGKITSLDWNNSGTQLLSGSDDNIVKKWTMNGELIYAYEYHNEGILKVDWNSNNTEFFTASLDNNILQINALTNSIIKGFYGHSNGIKQIEFHPFDNNLIAVSDNSHQILFWNIKKNNVKFILNNSNEKVSCFDFNKFIEQIVIGFYDGTMKIYNSNNGSIIKVINGMDKHTGRINDISFNPKANYFASAGSDGKIKIWNSVDGQLIKELEIHSDSVLTLDWHPSGNYLVSGGKDRIVKIIDVNTFNVINTLQSHIYPITDVVWNNDGDTLFTVDRSNKAYLWDTFNPVTDKKIGTLNDNNVNSGFVWNKLRNTLASPNNIEGVELWDTEYLVKKYNIPLNLNDKSYKALSVNWNSSGKILVSGSDKGTIHLFYFNHIPELVQADTSDDVFTIKSPIVTSFDVLMGYVNVGEDSTRNVYGLIANLTNAIVKVDSIELSGDIDEFDIEFPQTPFNLSNFEILTIPVTFHPSKAGELSTTFTIYTQNDTIINSVWGYGLRSDIKTRFVDFGIIQVEDQKDSLVTVLINLSDEELKINKIDLIDNNLNFSVDTTLTDFSKISPNDTLRLPLIFTPDSVGKFRAKLNFDIENEINQLTTELFGMGAYLKPNLNIIKEPEFKVYCQSTIYDTLTIKNLGSEILEIDSIYIVDTTNFAIKQNIKNYSLDSNETQNLILFFKPDTVGTYETQLIIKSNNYMDSVVSYTLLGNFEKLNLKIEPEEINIVSACGNFTIDTFLTITNENSIPFNIEIISDSLISTSSKTFTLEENVETKIPISITTPDDYDSFEYFLCFKNDVCNKIDSLKISIEVIEPRFQIDTTYISLSYSQSIDTNIIFINPTPINFIIDSVKILNNADIISLKPITQPLLIENSSIPIEFSYKALHQNIDTTILRVYLSPCNLFKDIVIITQPIPYQIILTCDTLFAKINDRVILPVDVYIKGDSNIVTSRPEIQFSICFNKHILNPVNKDLGYIEGNEKCVDYSIIIDSLYNRFIIPEKYLISLGDTDVTEIKFQKVKSTNSLVEIQTQNGVLIITNICDEGGKRFVISSNNIDIFTIYPNPTSGKITSIFSIPKEDNYTIQIIDKLGNIYKTLFQGIIKNGLQKITFNISDIQSGTYLLVIRNKDKISSKVLSIVK